MSLTLCPATPLRLPSSSYSPQGSMRHPSPSLEDNFTSPQLNNPRTQDVFQSIVKGRKSWKTLRGGEVVWPPELEAALIEGLENYEPDDSRETRLLGRFPLRNRFISDWIFEKTGKRRSAKQVGSRLQQLRDTCGGRKLLNLLSPRRPIPKRSSAPLSPGSADGLALHQDNSESGSDRSSPSAPATPTEVHATLQTLLYRGIASSAESPPTSVVCIDLLPPSDATPKAFFNSGMSSTREEELMWGERGMNVVKVSTQPRYISEIDPTVTFTSPTPISAVSVFSVYLDDDLVHSEDSPLKASGLLAPTHNEYLYSTRLLPGYWNKLCLMTDLSRHTIVHRVVEELQSNMSGTPTTSTTLFSTMYRFKYTQLPMSLLVPTFNTPHDLATAPPHKDSGLDFTFDESLLSMPSADGYYDKPQNFYDLSSWNSGHGIATYHGSQ